MGKLEGKRSLGRTTDRKEENSDIILCSVTIDGFGFITGFIGNT
jgi:hypothetical protein